MYLWPPSGIYIPQIDTIVYGEIILEEFRQNFENKNARNKFWYGDVEATQVAVATRNNMAADTKKW